MSDTKTTNSTLAERRAKRLAAENKAIDGTEPDVGAKAEGTPEAAETPAEPDVDAKATKQKP